MKEKIIRIGIILANESEELDSIIPIQIWRKAGYIVELISLEKKNSIVLKSGIKITCDGIIDKTNLSQFNALYIPGGNVYKKVLDPKSNLKVLKVIQKDFISNSKKYILTSNEGINVLTLTDSINGKEFTGIIENKIGLEKTFKEKDNIVVSNNLISSKGYMSIFDFSLEVIKNLSGNTLYKKMYAIVKQ